MYFSIFLMCYSFNLFSASSTTILNSTVNMLFCSLYFSAFHFCPSFFFCRFSSATYYQDSFLSVLFSSLCQNCFGFYFCFPFYLLPLTFSFKPILIHLFIPRSYIYLSFFLTTFIIPSQGMITESTTWIVLTYLFYFRLSYFFFFSLFCLKLYNSNLLGVFAFFSFFSLLLI